MSLAEAVTEWYDRHARDLPWRALASRPGACWSARSCSSRPRSTGSSRPGTPWMARWPTPADLAAEPAGRGDPGVGPARLPAPGACACTPAPPRSWSGTRGEVPADLDELLALPGVGTYTARAVAAFAYGQRHPVVDTNVRRVVARAVDGRGRRAAPRPPPPTWPPSRNCCPTTPTGRPGRQRRVHGARRVCSAPPGRPVCADCPLWTACAWRRAGAPMPAGPSRRTQRYAGTDRQVRGLLLAVLREATTRYHDRSWTPCGPTRSSAARALAGLLDDGLAGELDGHYALGAAPV